MRVLDGAPVIAVIKGAMSDIKTFVGITAPPCRNGIVLRRQLKFTFLKSHSVGSVKGTIRGT
jgi:hypothetical protein